MPDDTHAEITNVSQWRHDTRNKLNLVKGYASLLLMEDLSEEQMSSVQEIERAAKDIEALLDVLRDRFFPPEPPRTEVVLDE
jgi:signal transduction histidine kinase